MIIAGVLLAFSRHLPVHQSPYPSFPAKKIDAKIPGHPQNPLFEPLAPPKLPYLQKTLQHRVLGNIFCVVDVTQNTQAHSKNTPVMSLYKSGIRTLVATAACRNQDVI
jgi:hypothetical protein